MVRSVRLIVPVAGEPTRPGAVGHFQLTSEVELAHSCPARSAQRYGRDMGRRRYFESVNVVDGELNVLCHNDPRRNPTVFVLLHDADESAMSWQLVLDRLPANVAALAPDLRGRATSRTLAPPTNIEQFGDDLTRLLDHFGVDQAGLLGVGSGSVLAEHLGELLVERVAVTLGVERSLGTAELEEAASEGSAVDGRVG